MFPIFLGQVLIVSRTLLGIFLVGSLTTPRVSGTTNGPGEEVPRKDKKTKRTKKGHIRTDES